MASAHQILLVEDRDSLRRLMQRALEGEGYTVTAAATCSAGIEAANNHSFDLALTDLKLPDGSGLDVLAEVRRQQPSLPVVVLTAFGSVSTAVEAMKLGAVDFLEKPVELDDLFALVRSLLGATAAPAIFHPPGDAPAIVGRHPKIRAALRLLKKVAPTESNILLTGESGTGKELFARAAHALSKRSQGPFVAVNCAAIPEALMENELFGHEKGAFTGATNRHQGRFELARSGTLFLDEIGELKLAMQGKVLRVLEERTFERVGGSRPLDADVRIVAATNRNLSEMVAQGAFRQDLYYRLDVFPIELPPLNQRASDIPGLALHLAESLATRLQLAKPEVSAEALTELQARDWPGNVRQLANQLERALILSDSGSIGVEDLAAPNTPDSCDSEEQRIRQALLDAAGDKPIAAEQLGISYRSLQRKIRQLNLQGFPQYRS